MIALNITTNVVRIENNQKKLVLPSPRIFPKEPWHVTKDIDIFLDMLCQRGHKVLILSP